MDRRAAVGPGVWAVIKASAERRLGKPLLKTYFFLAAFGIVVVAVALFVISTCRSRPGFAPESFLSALADYIDKFYNLQ